MKQFFVFIKEPFTIMKSFRSPKGFTRQTHRPFRVYSTRVKKVAQRYHHTHQFVQPVLAPNLVPLSQSSL